MTAQGVNSNDINFGPKIGPRCQIENWPIGRLRQAFDHWQNWPETGLKTGPKIGPRFLMSIELTPYKIEPLP